MDYFAWLTYAIDPETYSWDPLNEDYLARLSVRKYVSMSLERRLDLPSRRISDANELGQDTQNRARYLGYQHDDTEADTNQNSAFSVGMPGLMSLDEIEDKIELGKWPLKLGNKLGYLEVSSLAVRNFLFFANHIDLGPPWLEEMGYQRSVLAQGCHR